MSANFQYDVFISYSSHDKAWVRGELLQRIEQAGLKAFIDGWHGQLAPKGSAAGGMAVLVTKGQLP